MASRIQIETQAHVDAVNEKFNHFHDGFIKQIRVISHNEFLTDMPWEDQRRFSSSEEELLATGLFMFNITDVELDIHHYNYDWPNQFRRRSIIVRASSAKMSDQLLSFIGQEIFDLTFAKDAAAVRCVLTHHAADAGPVRSMENGITTILFSAEKMEIEETEWVEPEGPGCGSQAGRT